jgi:serine phosphatase RsbU (regulator of sigma subunit)
MRQGTALVRGALVASAFVAVPVCGAGVAHALTVGVGVGGAHVSVGPLPDPPAVPTLPAPVGPIVHDVTQNAPPPVGGGSSNSGNNGGGSGSSAPSSSSPAPHTGSSGSGTQQPRVAGGGPSGGSSGGSGAPSTGRSKARHAARRGGRKRAARRSGGNGGTHAIARKASGGGGDKAVEKKKDTSSNPVSTVINKIEQVIPAPIWGVIGLLALLAGGFALRSRLVSRRAQRLERQREELLGDVGLLQRALLPDVPNDLKGIDVSVAYRPAEGPAAGGDFYDVFELEDGRTAIIVGDVCGHGRQALAVTALMRYTLRAYLGAGFEPRIALQVAGRTIEGDPDGELTTVVLAIYDAKAGTLTYACAGHEPPIVLGPGSHEPVTVYSSPPLGGFMATGHRQTTVPLPPGSAACFFTDGLVEARLGEKMMGRGRLTELVTELAPGEGAQLLLQRLAAAADRAPDDMAACLVRSQDAAVDARGVRIEELESDAAELEGDRVIEFLVACGIPQTSAHETLRSARAKASEFGGALLRVHASGKGGRVEILPATVPALPVPSLAAEARKRAAVQIPA